MIKTHKREHLRVLLLTVLVGVFPVAVLAQNGPGAPRFGLPVECTLGDDCYIQQYFDHDADEGEISDYACGALANDGHGGTDFAVATMDQVRVGVTVSASAPGVVIGVRDGMPDISVTDPAAPDLEGRDCGNGVVINHGGGWTSQYCHMRQGSVVAQKGQRIAMGTPLGLIGMSGRASFPHMHLTVRYKGEKVDPFAPGDGPMACMLADDTASDDSVVNKELWIEAPPYVPGGLIAAGFSDKVPTIEEIRNGAAPNADVSLPKAPAMVVWGYAFAGQLGDEIEIILEGPDGEIGRYTDVLKKTQPFVLRAYGKRTPSAGWVWGLYRGTVIHRRDGQELSRRVVETEVN